MDDYKIKSYSSDICFCYSDCNNTDCDRNMDGWLFNAAKKRQGDLFYYSTCNFGDKCSSYKGKDK